MPRPPADPLPLAPDEAPKRAPGAGATTQQIVDTITTAIVERRLMPGTKLAEQAVADLFGVSRTLVREALNRLSRDRLVTLEPGRGAFVARPSVDEARQVFDARRLLETGMVRELCARAEPAHVLRLRAHLAAEADAVRRHDVAGRTRLLAQFHVVLAECLGNAVLAELLADLLSRCSLIALMYQSADAAGHSQDEHVLIVDAIERRDADAAARLMAEHLGNVVGNLQRQPRVGDLADLLRPAA
ncbi:GntR family transcriptional regulator [Rubrivivax sp. JA1026]|uniref:GntR family transcriptional regulator n=1 Tax=Rubrivivax sp. JA1026 TaxID=2710888 RepID=UPI0013E99344|nr:GntR family transcriptional regulator [Rubrivivax sp. JA1026]